MWNWYVGQVAYSRFMARVFSTRGRDWRMLPTLANEQPAMVAYDRSGDHYQLHTLQVFTVERGAVVRTTVYQDPEVFAIFDLPKNIAPGRFVPGMPPVCTCDTVIPTFRRGAVHAPHHRHRLLHRRRQATAADVAQLQLARNANVEGMIYELEELSPPLSTAFGST